jgi:ribonuclease BN (tRNA processing enzyme)/isopentenyl phosphate kinase
MKKKQVLIVKLGGSLITYKRNKEGIEEYLAEIDRFVEGNGSLRDLNERISKLMNFQKLNGIFTTLSSFLSKNPERKIILIHGAGSIGHSLVLHLLEKYSNIQQGYSIVKLAVNIQNEFVVASAIKHGMNAISISSHQIMSGAPTDKISSKEAITQDLSVLEQIISNTNAVPIFYGDVGHTPTGWKVFSGDIVPSALMRRFTHLQISDAIFLTDVKGKKTGIYTKDPKYDDAQFISKIEVNNQDFICYDSKNNLLTFSNEKSIEEYDVTEAMGGKLRNLVELANGFIKCWVVGIEEFEEALNGNTVGTRILPQTSPKANILFLGTGDAFASSSYKSAGVFIELDQYGVLLDCGPHTLHALKKAGRKTDDIDLILVSHFHGDHFAGLPFILLEASIQQNRKKPLTIIGPPNIEDRVESLNYALYENIAHEKKPFTCHYKVISPQKPLELNWITIRAIEMRHTPESQGYRLETNKIAIAYSGDTGWTDNLTSLVKNTDLSIIECNFFETELDIHLNFHQAMKLAPLTKRLALIHLGNEIISKRYSLAKRPNVYIPYEGEEMPI